MRNNGSNRPIEIGVSAAMIDFFHFLNAVEERAEFCDWLSSVFCQASSKLAVMLVRAQNYCLIQFDLLRRDRSPIARFVDHHPFFPWIDRAPRDPLSQGGPKKTVRSSFSPTFHDFSRQLSRSLRCRFGHFYRVLNIERLEIVRNCSSCSFLPYGQIRIRNEIPFKKLWIDLVFGNKI